MIHCIVKGSERGRGIRKSWILLHLFLVGVCARMYVHVLRSEGNLRELVPSSQHVRPRH